MEAVPAAVATALLGLAVIYAVSVLSNGGTFDAQDAIVNDTPQTSGVASMALAIGHAEGFGVAGAIPTLANNPGDLKIPNWQGAKMGEGVSVFTTLTEGRARLYRQLNLIVNGQSKVYSLSDTIDQMAVKWTGSDNAQAWALIVASDLGTETGATLAEVLT